MFPYQVFTLAGLFAVLLDGMTEFEKALVTGGFGLWTCTASDTAKAISGQHCKACAKGKQIGLG